MEAIAVEQVESETFDIYIKLGPADPENGGMYYLHPDGNRAVLVHYGSEPPRYTKMPADVAHAIVKAIQPESHPDATERHLDDAIMTRDRLFVMLERALMPPHINVQPGVERR